MAAEALGGTPMLPPFIIEQIRKREEEERVRYEQPQLEMPLPRPMPRKEEKDEEPNRGVIILDL
jgi:hypothetical protein